MTSPAPGSGYPVCPKCGAAMDLEDKNTFTGREIREYRCPSCRHLEVEDRGEALWQILHNDRQEQLERERLRAKRPWWAFWRK